VKILGDTLSFCIACFLFKNKMTFSNFQTKDEEQERRAMRTDSAAI
jgi:hypothetical protein